MFMHTSSRSIFWLITFLFLFALSGCGGGNGPQTGTDGGVVADSTTDTGADDEVVADSEPDVETSPEDPPAALSVVARASGDAVPGQVAQLLADVAANDSPVAYSWRQTGGPPVLIEGANSKIARFRVPPLGRDTQFSFRVTVTDAGGDTARHRVRFNASALSWKSMRVVEYRVHKNFVVFRADKDIDNRVDLYRAALDGSHVIRLNGPLTPGGGVHTFSISPDGDGVAYLADEDTLGVDELFIVDSDGGGAIKASGDLVPGGNVSADFVWATDSSRVAYRADQNSDERFELFAGFADGRTNKRLSGDMNPDGDVVEGNFFWSYRSRRIAYRADQLTDEVFELFVSRKSGGDNLRVSAPLAPGGGVLGNFAWSPGGGYIAYIADQTSVGVFELFNVERNGSHNTRISGPLVADGTVLDFAWAPDGRAIAYRAEQLADSMVELFSVLPDGGDNTMVSGVPPGGDVGQFAWSPDGAAIGYIANQRVDDQNELFVAGPDGSGNHRASGSLAPNGDVLEFAWSPGGAYLAYRADELSNGVPELFTTMPHAPSSARVSGALAPGGTVARDWRWSDSGQWLAYRADQRFGGVIELYSVMPDGSSNVLLSGAMPVGGNVEAPEGDTFQWSADSHRIVYAADQITDQQFELFVAAPDAGVVNANLSGPLNPNGDVLNFSLLSKPGQSRPRVVAVLAAEASIPVREDVGAKLVGTGLFDSVEVIDVNAATPTLEQLQTYRGVLVYSRNAFFDSAAMGNVLADYVDSGGGVVVAVFALFESGPSASIGGRFASQNYFAIQPGASSSGGVEFGLGAADFDHPIMQGVSSFNGGTGTFRVDTLAVVSGATTVARWSDTKPLVATREIGGVRRVDLGFFPPSSDARSDFWDAATDGDLLMANALLYAMGEI